MGKKKAVSANLGKSIIRSRFGKNVNKSGESFLHTSDLSDGYEWGRLNLQSVTEQSNLDDFLATAELAGTEFTAEKLNISIVSEAKKSGLLSQSEQSEVSAAQEQHKELLRIPRRPPWDESTTPDELDACERTEFLNWRRGLAELQEVENIHLTPYEKNLDFWRQLWRVIERSDVVVQIVDARNPLLFRCVDLERYVKEVHADKVNLVLINKADYLNETQRKMWAYYFQKEGVLVAFWSALEETKKQEMENAEEMNEDKSLEMSDDESEIDENDDNSSEIMNSDDDDEGTTVSGRGDNCEMIDKQSDSPLAGTEPSARTEAESFELSEGVSAAFDSSNLNLNPPIRDTVCDISTEGVSKVRTESGTGKSQDFCHSQSLNTETKKSWDILSGEELLQLFRSIHTAEKVNENHTTVGMVGYPNVGKSSTINAILKMKKVPVSATPGRTKHFQTLFVEKELMLCDCPGLVFPSFVSTKAELVVHGILSIDQMRDHVPPVSLVCQQIPRPVLESVYGVNLPIPGECEDPNRHPTAQELLNAHGYMRGYMTSRGMPDNPRSSRYILKDYVNGKLLFCQPPPNMDVEIFQPTNQVIEDHSQHLLSVQSESSAAEVHLGSKNKKDTVVAPSSVDKEFFKKNDPQVRSKGIRGVTGFVRTNATGEHIPSSSASTDESTQSLAAKPWKKHNNRNKKEKSRRIHGDLDM